MQETIVWLSVLTFLLECIKTLWKIEINRKNLKRNKKLKQACKKKPSTTPNRRRLSVKLSITFE